MTANDVTTMVDLLSSVGFPIIACCAVWWFTNSICKELLETLQQNNQMLRILTKSFLSDDEGEGDSE